jgi:hypothetical protein
MKDDEFVRGAPHPIYPALDRNLRLGAGIHLTARASWPSRTPIFFITGNSDILVALIAMKARAALTWALERKRSQLTPNPDLLFRFWSLGGVLTSWQVLARQHRDVGTTDLIDAPVSP